MKIKQDASAVVDLLGTNTIYTFGNGGSASIADHMACDWMKLGGKRVISLACNTPLIMAIANDLTYMDTCSAQIGFLDLGPGDTLVVISSSGTSPNIVRAVNVAIGRGMTVIGFFGNARKSGGGPCKGLVDYCVYSDSEDYGVIEDYHSQVMHEVARILKRGNNG